VITTVAELCSTVYRREIVEKKPITDAELKDMTKLVSRRDIEARLAEIPASSIPKERCIITHIHREFLKRALALA
jgi:hypothetical protein